MATTSSASLAALEPLVGEWSMAAAFGDMPPRMSAPGSASSGCRASGSWSSAGKSRCPEAPDGIAIIGADPESEGRYLQHYFDSRGVARVYKMSLEDGVWKLWRDEPDFSPLDFHQRFAGTFSDDGTTIAGSWETSATTARPGSTTSISPTPRSPDQERKWKTWRQ